MKTTTSTLSCFLLMISCGGESGSEAGNRRYAELELETTYPHAFSYLSGVRELSDGTILAADPTSQVVLRLSLESGTADTLGREGKGPNEYRGPDRVFPLPGDSSLLVDLGNGRLTVIDPDGRFVDWTPMTNATDDGIGRTIHPSFVDAAGNIYASGLNYRDDPPDSTTMYRIDRDTGDETRVAATWRTPYVGRRRGEKRPMLRPHDDWAVGSNGSVAAIRANGYSVDWQFPDGRVVSGPPNDVETYPCGTLEQEAELDNFASNAIYAVTEVSEEGVQSLSMRRGIPASAAPELDDLAWPETLPLFTPGSSVISPAGEVWVKRMMPVGGPGRADVFDAEGIRVGFIELPAQSQVVGFGRTGQPRWTVYLARTDEVGLIWLERYRVIR